MIYSTALDTAASLVPIVPNLIKVPKLFKPPAEGYPRWLERRVDDPAPIRPGTIPHRILEAEGEARHYGVVLLDILATTHEKRLMKRYGRDAAVMAIEETFNPDDLKRIADMEDLPQPLRWAAAAKRCRCLFDMGYPLYIGYYGDVNRYKRVIPVLVYKNGNRYRVGGPKMNKEFLADDHVHAVRLARDWYNEARLEEIAAAKKATSKAPIPRMVGDLLGHVLERDDELLDLHGSKIAWKNGGIHGRFGVNGPDWAYIMKCSPITAGKMAALAFMQGQKQKIGAALAINLGGRVHEYLDFGVDAKGVLTFEAGVIRAHPHKDFLYGIAWNNAPKPFAQIEIIPVEGNNLQMEFVRVTSVPSAGKPKLIAESVVPRTWGLLEKDCLAWGAYCAIGWGKRNRKK